MPFLARLVIKLIFHAYVGLYHAFQGPLHSMLFSLNQLRMYFHGSMTFHQHSVSPLNFVDVFFASSASFALLFAWDLAPDDRT